MRWITIGLLLACNAVVAAQSTSPSAYPQKPKLTAKSVAELKWLTADYLLQLRDRRYSAPNGRTPGELAMLRAWRRADATGLAKDVDTLRRIFSGVYPVSGRPDRVRSPAKVILPVDHNPERESPLVLVVPGWTRGDHLPTTDTWLRWSWPEGSRAILAVAARLWSQRNMQSLQPGHVRWRVRECLAQVLTILHKYRVDDRRIFLDVGMGKARIWFEFASYFPDVFAGIILRHPDELDSVGLTALRHVQVLILQNLGNATEWAKVRAQLADAGIKNVEVADALGPYPFPGSAPTVRKWMEGVLRPWAPTNLVYEPRVWPKGEVVSFFWAQAKAGEPTLTKSERRRKRVRAREQDAVVDLKTRPRFEVRFDRKKKNLVTVRRRNVPTYTIFLNDAMLDLDKPVIVRDHNEDLGPGTAPQVHKLRLVRDVLLSIDTTSVAAETRVFTAKFEVDPKSWLARRGAHKLRRTRAGDRFAGIGPDESPDAMQQRVDSGETVGSAGRGASGSSLSQGSESRRPGWSVGKYKKKPTGWRMSPMATNEERSPWWSPSLDQSLLWGVGLLAAFLLGIGLTLLIRRG